MTKPRRKKAPPDDKAQSARFRKAAREAGVDPNADIDEVMRRLAEQRRLEMPKKGGKPNAKKPGNSRS
jgi:hypothetical protein